MMVIDNKYDLGQTVYLTTDENQKPRIVMHIKILPNDLLVYDLSNGIQTSSHYEFEITGEKQTVIS